MAAFADQEAIPKPSVTRKEGVRLQKVGNSRGFVIPKEIVDFFEARAGSRRREAAFDITFRDAGEHGSISPTVEITEGYVRSDRDGDWARSLGKRAFHMFYCALGIHPGMAEEEQVEAACEAHGEGLPWQSVLDFYRQNDVAIEMRHGCIDTARGETNADAELLGCDDGEYCHWSIKPGRLPDIIKSSFDAEAQRCWPDSDVRGQMLYPDL